MQVLIVPHLNIADLIGMAEFEGIHQHYLTLIYDHLLKADYFFYREESGVDCELLATEVMEGDYGEAVYEIAPRIPREDVSVWITEACHGIQFHLWPEQHLIKYMFKNVYRVDCIGPETVALFLM